MLKPITNRYNVSVDKGVLSATGQFELGSQVRRLELQEATIDGIKTLDFHPHGFSLDLKGVTVVQDAHEPLRRYTEAKMNRALKGYTVRIKVDYIHTPQTAAVEHARVTGAVKAAKAASNAPDLLVKIARLRITKSTFGYVNKMTSLPYRAFVSDAEVTLTNLSNQTTDGMATAKLQGKFMGSGSALVDAKFHTEKSGPAFELSVRITDVR